MSSTLLPATLALAVPLYIQELKALPPDQFWQQWQEWGDRARDDGAFSEAVLYRVKGESARAFNALARLIAAMAFVPGGVRVFGMHFDATPPGAGEAQNVLC
jgi:hypothetical protein